MEEINNEILDIIEKRRLLILKIIAQLYKGKIGTLYFKNGSIYRVCYHTSYSYIKQVDVERKKFNPLKDSEELKDELMKNIHDIYEHFDKESLFVLEFLMNKMDNSFYMTDKDIIEKIKNDIQEIKNRCVNYILIMAIEEEKK